MLFKSAHRAHRYDYDLQQTTLNNGLNRIVLELLGPDRIRFGLDIISFNDYGNSIRDEKVYLKRYSRTQKIKESAESVFYI